MVALLFVLVYLKEGKLPWSAFSDEDLNKTIKKVKASKNEWILHL
jgi:hypothetical protein